MNEKYVNLKPVEDAAIENFGGAHCPDELARAIRGGIAAARLGRDEGLAERGFKDFDVKERFAKKRDMMDGNFTVVSKTAGRGFKLITLLDCKFNADKTNLFADFHILSEFDIDFAPVIQEENA